jgi:hypothetical protein
MTSKQVDAISRKEASDLNFGNAFGQDYPEVSSLLEKQQAELQALLGLLGLTDG